MTISKSPLTVLLTTALLAGCSATEKDWSQARVTNTTAAYAVFLAKHPHGSHVDEARAAIDDLDWKAAKADNSRDSYNKYLSSHPTDRHSAEAKTAIEAIEDATVVPMDLPCGARVKQMSFTFSGLPSGDLMGFECQNQSGKTVQIGLKSMKLIDGRIETQDFGVIVIDRATGIGARYLILQGQLKKLQALLGFATNASLSTSQFPDASAKK